MRTVRFKLFAVFTLLLAVLAIACTSHSSTPLPEKAVYKISGEVTGTPGGVHVLVTPDNVPTVTARDGSYVAAGFPNGTYTVSASLPGYTFSPEKWTVTINGKDVTGINFVGTPTSSTTHSISGAVTGAPATGITVTLMPSNVFVKINTGDNFGFLGLPSGSYTVTPKLVGYSFSPESINIAVGNADVTGVNFTCTIIPPSTYSISGTVSGAISAGVTMTLTPGNIATHTAADGTYKFVGVPNGPATVTPSFPGEIFSPTHADVPVNGADVTGINFVGTTPPTTLSTGKLLYPCLLPGSTGVYGIWMDDLSSGQKSLVEASTAIPDGLIPLRIKKCAYRDTSGIWILSLPTGGVFLAIPVGYTEAPGYLSTTFGSFDVGPSGDFAAVMLKSTTGKKDIFLIQTDSSVRWTQVTTDGINTSPVVGAANATTATILFIKNGTEIWKQVVSLNATTAASPATLFASNVVDSVRPMSVSADYTMLAFMKNVGGAAHIIVIPLAGGTQVDLGAGSDPHWTLDGSNKILYHTADNTLWVVSADGTGKTQVPAQTNPTPLGAASVVFGPAGF